MKDSGIVIALKDLLVRRETVILSGVDWTVRKGERWAVMGANGSGKTSLVSALAGYVTPSDGEMRVLGETYGRTDWRDLRRHIGLVSSSLAQRIEDRETALDAVASGRYSQINFWGTLTAKDRKDALEILRGVECGALAGRRWGVLSQGERQRVVIGRALMGAPRLLILDEPCAGLDPAARESFLDFVTRLARRKNAPALVLVTHHAEEIPPAFTHLLLLKAGRVLARGPIAQTLTPKNLSAAFGASVRIKKENGRYRLTVLPKHKKIV